MKSSDFPEGPRIPTCLATAPLALFVLRSGAQCPDDKRALGFRYLEQRGIKLDEGVIHGAVLGMAGIARGAQRNHLGLGSRLAESEERPLAGKTSLIFHFCFDGDQAALIVSAVVNRALGLRGPDFQHKDGLVGPLAGSEERPVSRGVDEHIVERWIAVARGFGGGAVGHAQTRAQ